MRVRFLLPIVAGAGIALLAAAPVTAQTPYPPTAEPLLTVSETTVVVGDTVTVEGSGYQPGELVLITVETTPIAAAAIDAPQPERQLAIVPVARTVPVAAGPGPVASSYPKRVRADENGSFTAKVKLTEVGRATITATGQSSGISEFVVVTVLASADELPETGSDAWPLLRIGGTSVALGAMLLLASLAWRRYRPRATG